MKCAICGKDFQLKLPNGEANGISVMAMDKVTVINLCAECIRKNKEDPGDFIDRFNQLMKGDTE